MHFLIALGLIALGACFGVVLLGLLTGGKLAAAQAEVDALRLRVRRLEDELGMARARIVAERGVAIRRRLEAESIADLPRRRGDR